MAKHICPVWIGYLLASPIRRMFQNPDKILGPYIQNNMTVLDLGCAMGFFSLPVARMVGENGRVICVDIQEDMIKQLKKRASKVGIINRIEARVCNENSLELDDIENKIDFAYAIAIVHEVPDTSLFFSQIFRTLKSGCKLLISEPKGHIRAEDFEKTLSIAKENGFAVSERSKERFGYIAVLKK